MACSEDVDESVKEILALLVLKLEGQRYGRVDEDIGRLVEGDERAASVWEWLKEEMDS